MSSPVTATATADQAAAKPASGRGGGAARTPGRGRGQSGGKAPSSSAAASSSAGEGSASRGRGRGRSSGGRQPDAGSAGGAATPVSSSSSEPNTKRGRGRARDRGSSSSSSGSSGTGRTVDAASSGQQPSGRGKAPGGKRGKRGGRAQGATAFCPTASDFVPPATETRAGQHEHEEHDASATCLVCLEVPKLWSLGECNHRVLCIKCSLRYRVLYQDSSCPMCRMRLEEVVAVVNGADGARPFADVSLAGLPHERSAGMYFTTPEGEALSVQLLHTVNCPVCAAPCGDVNKLKRHVTDAHQMVYCDVCLRHRKLFLPEQSVYGVGADIKKHMKHGDENDPEAPRGHLICTFCSKYFYDMDEHYDHMTDAHEECQMCRMHGKLYQFYADYASLERHFGADHYLCKEQRCLEDRYVVFATANELTAHNVAFHLNSRKMSKREQRATRQLQLPVTYSAHSTSAEEEERLREQAEQLRMLEMAEAERMRKMRNDEVVARMISLIGDVKYNHFRGSSKLFLQGSLSASDFYDMFLRTFGAEANSLFEGVIDLLPDQFSARAAALRAAKNRWEARCSEFPSLAQSSLMQPRLSSSNLSYLLTASGRSSSPAASSAPPPMPLSALAPAPVASGRPSFAAAVARSGSAPAPKPPAPAKAKAKPPAAPKPKPPAADQFPALSSGPAGATKAAGVWGPAAQTKGGAAASIKKQPAQQPPPLRSAIVTPPPGIDFYECFNQGGSLPDPPVWPVARPAAVTTPAASSKKKRSKRGETLLTFG